MDYIAFMALPTSTLITFFEYDIYKKIHKISAAVMILSIIIIVSYWRMPPTHTTTYIGKMHTIPEKNISIYPAKHVFKIESKKPLSIFWCSNHYVICDGPDFINNINAEKEQNEK